MEKLKIRKINFERVKFLSWGREGSILVNYPEGDILENYPIVCYYPNFLMVLISVS